MIFTTPHDKAKHLDSGIRSLKIKDTHDASQLSTLAAQNPEKRLHASLESENPESAIRKLSPLDFYQGIVSISAEFVQDALIYSSIEQFTALLDIDCWQDDEFNKMKAMVWLTKMFERSNVGQDMFEKFRSLEEEYQLSMINSQISFIDAEEYDLLSDLQRGTYIPLPDHQSFYKILSQDDVAQNFFQKMIDASMHHDIEFLMSFLAYSTYSIPAESEFQLQQFRRARLEEEGFFSYEEAIQTFVPSKISEVAPIPDESPATQTSIVPSDDSRLFIEIVLEKLKEKHPEKYDQARQQFYYFANNLCNICQVDPSDFNGIKNILKRIESLCSLALEHLSQRDIVRANTIVHSQHPKHLFKIALGLINVEQSKVIEQMKKANVPGIEVLNKLFTQHKWGALQTEIDKKLSENMDLDDVEFLKGIFNRFPLLLDRSDKSSATYEYVEISSLYKLEKLKTAIQNFSQSIKLYFYN